MLYPIELLRQIRPANTARRTACMLTGTLAFVMSSVGFLLVGKSPSDDITPANRANCIATQDQHCKMQSPPTSEAI